MTARPMLGGPGSPPPPDREPALSSDHPYLTPDGRLLLEERIRLLEATVEQLRNALDEPEGRAEAVEGHQRATHELDRLRSLVSAAHSVEDVPDDPDTVELGDTVTIHLANGARETYIIVHPLEVTVDDQRISVESPLATALLGRHVGDDVEVSVPGGSYHCTIHSAKRNDEPGLRQGD